MNDFTKEELIYLHNSIDFQILKNKIKSMSENYFEHEMITIFSSAQPIQLKPKNCKCASEFGCGGSCSE